MAGFWHYGGFGARSRKTNASSYNRTFGGFGSFGTGSGDIEQCNFLTTTYTRVRG